MLLDGELCAGGSVWPGGRAGMARRDMAATRVGFLLVMMASIAGEKPTQPSRLRSYPRPVQMRSAPAGVTDLG
jgi:hypothetical protein